MRRTWQGNSNRWAGVGILMLLLASVFAAPATAQTKPAAKPAAPAAKPAAPAKSGSSAPAKTGGAATPGKGTSTTSKGPTTTSKGPTTTGGKTTTTTGGKTTTTTAGAKTTTTAGSKAAPAAGAKAASPGSSAKSGGGSSVKPVKGEKVTKTAGGAEVHTRADGSRRAVTKGGMTVSRGRNGSRHVSVERADHSRVYVGRGGRGYNQRPFMHGGHEYGARTYHGYGGRDRALYYRRYGYHGIYLEGYAPAHYWAPGFYGWAYNPWISPVPWAWGWAGNPWYGYYGPYFAPYPVYPSASFWLTDYLVSQSLQAAYVEQQGDSRQPPPPLDASNGPAPLTPEVKQQIADEVQRQIALTNAEAAQVAKQQEIDPASSGLPRLLSDNKTHVFVVGLVLDLVDNSGVECEVTQGDVLQLSQAPPPEAPAADLTVVASKGADCRKGNQVSVTLQDLQEMQNHLRATIDQGMGELKAKAGQGGLPALPAVAKGPEVDAPFAAVAPPPDPNVAAELTQQSQEADKVEKEAQTGGPSAGGDTPPAAAAPAAAAPAAPVTIEVGQTIDQVVGALGNPVSIASVGTTKKIYVYKDMKVTFVNGKVSDIK